MRYNIVTVATNLFSKGINNTLRLVKLKSVLKPWLNMMSQSVWQVRDKMEPRFLLEKPTNEMERKKCRGLRKFVPRPSTSHNNCVLAHPPQHLISACLVTTSLGLITPHPPSFAQSFRLGKSTTSLHHHWNRCFTHIFCCIPNPYFFINSPNVPTRMSKPF